MSNEALLGTTGSSNVVVILAYYNGAHFIGEQLRSILRQTVLPRVVNIYDDASEQPFESDYWHAEFESSDVHFSVYRREKNIGFAQNFLRALASLELNPNDYVAFCDQDDVWHPNKLEVAVHNLSLLEPGVPGLYCSRTRATNCEGNTAIGLSPLFSKSPSFQNALVQNIAGGNTMLLNSSAAILFKNKNDIAIVSHDWWCYLLVAGVGGKVIYDSEPRVDYRQHRDNLVGENSSLAARLSRVIRLLSGQLKHWSDVNIRALLQYSESLTPENQIVLAHFVRLRSSGLLSRFLAFYRSGVYRQTFLDNVGLICAVVLKKI